MDSIRGRLLRRGGGTVVVEVGGMALAVAVSSATESALSSVEIGNEVRVPTYLNLRQDAVELFGFIDDEERGLFRALLVVSGIGPRLALAIVGALPPHDFVRALTLGDEKTLQRAPGVGRKLAQRMLVELRDRFSAADAAPARSMAPSAQDSWSDAVLALVTLGYDRLRAQRVVMELQSGGDALKAGEDPQVIVRAALARIRG